MSEQDATMTADVYAAFQNVVLTCARTPEFLAEFNRLAGCSLGVPRSGLIEKIDEVTGWEQEQLRRFVEFVTWTVWRPLMTTAVSS